MSAKVGQRRQNDNVIGNTSGNRHGKSNKTKDDRVLPPVLAGPFAYRVRQQRIHANIQQEKTCAMHCFCASGFGSWGVLHALGRGSVMDEAWMRSMGRRLNGSMDDANAAERPATCHSRFAGSTAIEEACGHLGEASCRAVHFCTWHEEDAYNSHASGCFEHLDWFSDGTFPARAYACDARMTDKLAASFLEPRIPWLAASVIYLRCWGTATLLLLVAGLT